MGLNLPEILTWWLTLEITGLAAMPIALHICRNLKDHGYSASKPLGLLLLTYVSWIISFFAGYSSILVLLSSGIIAAGSFIVYWKKGILIDRNYVIKFEILFFIGFLVFAIIRAYSPAIYWSGGEKFMDMSFINSLLRTSQFPPLDPWMSGTALQYYYFGYLIVADLIKLTGILPSIAFNLATASFFALSLTTAFGIGYNLTERKRYGIITAFFVVVAGNLAGFFQLMDIIMKDDALANILSFNYWTSSRVIPDTINEFPFFSFLQGDVHAHMISITFALLVILLLLNLFKTQNTGWSSIFVLGISIGFLYPLNTWDYPVYLFLAIFVIAFRFFLSSRQSHKSIRESRMPISAIFAVSVFSYIMFLPYHLFYKLDRAISFVSSGRTSLILYVAVYGLFLFLICNFILAKSKKISMKYFRAFLIFLSIAAVILILESESLIININKIIEIIPKIKFFELELFILIIPLLILSLISIVKEQDENHAFVIILIITGILISLFCELFYITDALGTGNPALIRLNTVFKLYLSNWILWAVSAGYIVYIYRESFSRKKTWGITAALLVLMVSVYPVLATIGKSGHFHGEPTLDGEAYVRKEHPLEYEAIYWLRNISGEPVILQAPGNAYSWSTYITTFTGFPTVIGWAGHEITWRIDPPETIKRLEDVDKIYESTDQDEVNSLLKKYNVSYIYFGEAEARKYGSPELFEANPDRFAKVFEFGDIVIFKVV